MWYPPTMRKVLGEQPQLVSSRALHVLQTRCQSSGKAAEAGSVPIWLQYILHFSDFSDMSNFEYNFIGIPNSYYL